MLAKPAMQIPHEGGLRFEVDSDYYKTIYKWISEGAPYGEPALDAVAELSVEPAEIFMEKPGGDLVLKVMAKYGDGSTRDVSGEAVIASNLTSTAKINDDGSVHGERIGEAAVMVRYEGKFVTVPITILNPEPGFEWQQLSQHNFIDKHIDAKLKRPKDSTCARGQRRQLHPSNLPRPHGNSSDTRTDSCFSREHRLIRDKARAVDRPAHSLAWLRRSLGAQVGRPAAVQPQTPG